MSPAHRYLLVLIWLVPVLSQARPDSTVAYGWLPIVSFNTDDGFIGGLEMQRFDYRGMRPFRSFTRLTTYATGAGAYTISGLWDRPSAFGTDLRLALDLHLSRFDGNFYPGLSRSHPWVDALADTGDHFRFGTRSVNLGAAIRLPLQDLGDLKTGFRWHYDRPVNRTPGGFMNTERPSGWDGSRLLLLETGWVRDRRDSEFRADRGHRIDAGLAWALPAASTHRAALLQMDLRNYQALNRSDQRPVWAAMRLKYQQVFGDAPFWMVPSVGGRDTVRGIPWRRFVAESVASANVDLRSWLIRLPDWKLEGGLSLFADAALLDAARPADHAWVGAVGVGGMASVFTPDFILTYELGFSAYGTALYLGSALAF